MREILFRGKRIYDKKWIYGNLVIDNSLEPHIVPRDFFFEDGHHLVYDDETDSPVFVLKDSVGQYTGLKDAKGTRIFEADIVKVYDVYCNETVVGVVEFCDGSLRIYDTDFTSYDRWMYYKVEVIGNAYDNQELLEEDKT